MRFLVQSLAVLGFFLGALTADAADLDTLMAERSLGDPAAPVTIHEYSSLTCPHCAQFHMETLPRIKEAYIDTGQARFVYHDFPLNTTSAMAAMVARCVDPERYFGFLDVLYGDLEGWAASGDVRRQLEVRARLAGLSAEEFDACLRNEGLFEALSDQRDRAAQTVGIDSTPTFVINGQKLVGAYPFEDFARVIDAELAEAQQPASGTD